MKKLLLPFLVLMFLVSCEKESMNEPIIEDQIYEDGCVTTRSVNKRDVCHNGKIKNISINAIPAHQAHGDAVDMDGDGYFDIDNPCSETDCDDTAYDPENSCSCVEGELEVTLPDGSTLYVHPIDNTDNIPWGENANDIDNPIDLVNIPMLADANADFSGAANTIAIVAELGDWNDGIYAANLCATLSAETGCEWYLPAAGELKAMYEQLGPGGSNNFTNSNYWSSTEKNISEFWAQNFGTGSQVSFAKLAGARCRCVRR